MAYLLDNEEKVLLDQFLEQNNIILDGTDGVIFSKKFEGYCLREIYYQNKLHSIVTLREKGILFLTVFISFKRGFCFGAKEIEITLRDTKSLFELLLGRYRFY